MITDKSQIKRCAYGVTLRHSNKEHFINKTVKFVLAFLKNLKEMFIGVDLKCLPMAEFLCSAIVDVSVGQYTRHNLFRTNTFEYVNDALIIDNGRFLFFDTKNFVQFLSCKYRFDIYTNLKPNLNTNLM